jgi:hypothetical protein
MGAAFNGTWILIHIPVYMELGKPLFVFCKYFLDKGG